MGLLPSEEADLSSTRLGKVTCASADLTTTAASDSARSAWLILRQRKQRRRRNRGMVKLERFREIPRETWVGTDGWFMREQSERFWRGVGPEAPPDCRGGSLCNGFDLVGGG